MGAGAVGAARISRRGRSAGLGGWLAELAQHIAPACSANLAAGTIVLEMALDLALGGQRQTIKQHRRARKLA